MASADHGKVRQRPVELHRGLGSGRLRKHRRYPKLLLLLLRRDRLELLIVAECLQRGP